MHTLSFIALTQWSQRSKVEQVKFFYQLLGLKGNSECCKEVRYQSPAKCLAAFELASFWFFVRHLNPLNHSPLNIVLLGFFSVILKFLDFGKQVLGYWPSIEFKFSQINTFLLFHVILFYISSAQSYRQKF